MGALTGILIAVLLSALDQTIVNPALTAIATDLHAVNDLSWIIIGYFVTSTAFMPVYGKLSDIYGRARNRSCSSRSFARWRGSAEAGSR